MTCEHCDPYLIDLADGGAGVPSDVREHVEGCVVCTAEVEALKSTLRQSKALQLEEPPLELDVAILQAARTRGRKPTASWWMRPSPQLAMAAAVMLAVGVGVWQRPPGLSTEAEPVTDWDNGASPAYEVAAADVPAPVEQANVEGTGLDALETGESRTLRSDEMRARKVVGKTLGSKPEPARHAATTSGVAKKKSRSVATRGLADRADKKSNLGRSADDAFGGVGSGAARPRGPAPTAGVASAAKGARQAGAVVPSSPAAAEDVESVFAEVADQAERKERMDKEQDTPADDDAQAYAKRCRQKVPAYERALSRLKQGDPGVPELELELGRCHRAMGQLDTAQRWLVRAAKHAPTERRARRELESMAEDAGR